jgi:phage tail-like protein
MPTDTRNDPFRGFNFRVEIEGLPVAAFTEVTGLTAEGDPVDYREGTDPTNNVRKLVGLRKYSNLMFKRGYTQTPRCGIGTGASPTASPIAAMAASCS